MKKLTGICFILAVVLSITACKKGDKVKETTLYIEDGKVTEAIVESDEKDYYNEKELTDWVENVVKDYNKENSKVLEIEKCEIEKDKAKVTIVYPSLQDYSSFNHLKAFEGTIAEAKEAGYELEGEFRSTKGKPSVTYAELEGSKEYHVIVLEIVAAPQTVVLEEDVLYVSSNVKADKNQAKIKKETKDLAYIIYKP